MADMRKIVLLGKTGSGKSSLGNTLFGENKFLTDDSACSGTGSCQFETNERICLVDTPGFFDTDPNNTENSSEIFKCMTLCAPGPHVFLIVLKVEKYTMHEKMVIHLILKYFKEEALKFTTVVFTRGDDLPEGMKIEDWVRRNEALNDLVQKCGGRCHVFDNKYWKNSTDEYRNNTYQVQELIKTIDNTVRENGGKHYSNKMLQKLGEEIQKEMEQLEATLGGILSKVEIHKEAKEKVFKKFVTKVKENKAGIVLGALLGVGVLAPLVVLGLPCVVSGAVIGTGCALAFPAVGGAIEDRIKQKRKTRVNENQEDDEQALVAEEQIESENDGQEMGEL